MKTLTHESTGRTVNLSNDDPLLDTFLSNGWKEKKADGPRKSRRGGAVSAKDADDAGADES